MRITLLFSLLLSIAGSAWADHYTVESLANNTFSPRDLTINVGDTVTWVNRGGRHNVLSNDGSVRCAEGCDGAGGNGDPSTSAWSFSLTFNSEELFEYICELHAGIGMVGSVRVVAATSEPGTLSLGTATQSAGEAAGAFNVEVRRSGGTDGAVSVAYDTADGSARAGADYTGASGVLSWADGEASAKSFSVPIINDTNSESSETLTVRLSSPTGGAALGSPSTATLTIVDDDQAPPDDPGVLSFQNAEIEVSEADGGAVVTVRRSGGSSGAVSVTYTASDGSALAGLDYSPTSGTLSWNDGDSSNRSFTLPILDDDESEGPETVNLALSSPTGGADLGTSAATVTVVDDEPFVCTPDDYTLCLGGGRFLVDVVWESADAVDFAKAVDIGRDDSGLFFFFSENNIEMLIKVLDGCNINGHYWVSYAATTDVGFEVLVFDTETGVQKTYVNELGTTAPPVLDLEALHVCP